MINFDAIIFLTFLPLLFISIIVLIFRKKSIIYISFWSALFLYLIFVIKYTIFPIPVNTQYLTIMRKEVSFSTNINLFPLWLDNTFIFLTNEHIMNIILGVPFGFLVNYLRGMKTINIIFLGLSFGLGIEFLQLSLSLVLNYYYRIIDINDVFFNICGVVIGYFLFLLVSIIYLKFIDENFEHNKLTQFIYNASTGNR